MPSGSSPPAEMTMKCFALILSLNGLRIGSNDSSRMTAWSSASLAM